MIPLLILGGPAFANGDKITGSVDIQGGYATTEKAPAPGVKPNDYNADRTTVTARYEIGTKIDPATGKKVFDLTNSKVVLENEFKKDDGTNFKTDPVPITKIDGDPETGKIKSMEVKGTKWDPDRPDESSGIEGQIEFPTDKAPAKGWFVARYDLKSGSKYAYTFNSVQKPAENKAEPAPGGDKPEKKTGGSAPQSQISFDAATGILSLGSYLISQTNDLLDPVLGATLALDDYDFLGLTLAGDKAIFEAVGDGLLGLESGGEALERAVLPVLYYDVSADFLFGGLFEQAFAGMSASSPFYDPALSGASSPFFDAISAYLDPASPDFDAADSQFMVFRPGANLFDATGGFVRDGSTSATASQFVAPAQVPLPLSIWGSVSAIGALLFLKERRGAVAG